MKLPIMSTIITLILGALAAPTTEGQDKPNSGLGSRGVASGCYPLYESTPKAMMCALFDLLRYIH